MKNQNKAELLTMASVMFGNLSFTPDTNASFNNSNSDSARELAKRKTKANRILNTNPNNKKLNKYSFKHESKYYYVFALNEKMLLENLKH